MKPYNLTENGLKLKNLMIQRSVILDEIEYFSANQKRQKALNKQLDSIEDEIAEIQERGEAQ